MGPRRARADARDHLIRVAHLIAPVAFGGGEALLTDLLACTQPGLEESVITVGHAPRFADALATHGLRCDALGGHEVGTERAGRIGELRATPALVWPLRRLVADLAPDVLHAHGFPPSLLGALPLRSGLRRVYTHHYERQAPRAGERAALTAVLRRYDALTTVADHLSERMTSWFPRAGRPFTTLPIGLADRFYDAPPDPSWRHELEPDTLVLACVGRLIATKNQELAIRAVAEARQRGTALGLVIAGSGPDEGRLRALVSELGLGGTVRFVGQVDRERMPSLLAGVDAGVLPTRTEASSLAAAELLAAGKPVLALDLAPMRESIGDAGVLVPEARFADGLVLLAEQLSSLSANARERGEQLRARAVRPAWTDLYREVLRRRR